MTAMDREVLSELIEHLGWSAHAGREQARNLQSRLDATKSVISADAVLRLRTRIEWVAAGAVEQDRRREAVRAALLEIDRRVK